MKQVKTMLGRAQQYLKYRRKLGFALKIEGMQLLQFARYVDELGHTGPLTTQLAVRWARLPANAAPLYHARRLEVVRCFAKYLAIYDSRTEIPPNGLLGSAHARPHPYIYSEHEVTRIMRAAQELSPRSGIRPKTYTTLFGLLASTGLRIGEALKLRRNDVDLEHSVLTVFETKFKKSRLVVLHPSTKRALQKYVAARDHYHPISTSDAFFLSERGVALNYSTVRHTFRAICASLELKTCGKRGVPRMYDMRHTFACRRLTQWYRQKVDIDHGMAALSTYMGHAKVTDTYWYITGVPELMQIAAQRFDSFTHTNQKEGHSWLK